MAEEKDGAKQDMIDRKISSLERIFDKLYLAVKSDGKSTIVVILIMYSVFITIKYINLNDLSKAEIIAEVRRTAKAEAEKQVAQQMQPIKDSQAEQGKKVDTSLNNLNGTVESVKQFVKKNIKK
ncbi:hypothetical protein [Arcticibacter sp.]|uniref:hypothetical protein n=1 Tax=Arcticibacter sp. TaxID=1872630 RepID=UPI00388D8D7C